MNDDSLVTLVVSDPWEFPDENEGRIAFVAEIVGNANGRWLLRLQRPITYEGIVWKFAIPSTRFVGQRYFNDLSERNTSANILFITDEQAASKEFLATYDSKEKPSTPWVIGSVGRGISNLIPPGLDSYIEPTWTQKH